MGEAVFVNQQNPVHAPPHPVLVVLVPHPLEPGRHAGVLLEERVLGAEGVVAKGVEVHGPTEGEGGILREA